MQRKSEQTPGLENVHTSATGTSRAGKFEPGDLSFANALSKSSQRGSRIPSLPTDRNQITCPLFGTGSHFGFPDTTPFSENGNHSGRGTPPLCRHRKLRYSSGREMPNLRSTSATIGSVMGRHECRMFSAMAWTRVEYVGRAESSRSSSAQVGLEDSAHPSLDLDHDNAG